MYWVHRRGFHHPI